MKKFIRSAALIAIAAVSACHKEINIAPVAATESDTVHRTAALPATPALSADSGAISGSVSPAAGVKSVKIYHDNPFWVVETIVNAAGKFTFKRVAAGSYTVGIQPAAHYISFEGSRSVVVTNAKTSNLQPFLVYKENEAAGLFKFTYKADGVLKAPGAVAGATYTSPKLHLYNYYIALQGSGSPVEPKRTPVDGIEIYLDKVTGPGRYLCKNTSSSTVRLIHRSVTPQYLAGFSLGPQISWSTTAKGGSASVTITAIDKVKRLLSGTFSAVLVAETGTGASGTIKITGGAFVNYKY